VSERLDRHLAAVMSTDIVGYTALMQTDEGLGLDKRDRYMRALEGHHEAFGGTIVSGWGTAP
jgi:adenylate cyclase